MHAVTSSFAQQVVAMTKKGKGKGAKDDKAKAKKAAPEADQAAASD